MKQTINVICFIVTVYIINYFLLLGLHFTENRDVSEEQIKAILLLFSPISIFFTIINYVIILLSKIIGLLTHLF